MTDRLAVRSLLACLTVATACGDAPALAPAPARAITSVHARPTTVSLTPRATVQLTVVALDQRHVPLLRDVTIAYASDAPAVARVDGTGLVTGVAAGTATIRATATLGSRTRHALTTAHVVSFPDPADIVLTYGSGGWWPSRASLPVGGVARWRIDPAAGWTGSRVMVYVLDGKGMVIDSLDLSRGTATRRLDVPGSVRYCSDGCREDIEFGFIEVVG